MSSLFRNLCRTFRLPASPEASDGQLLERFVATREEGAFAALVERHGPMVHGVCCRILGNGADAEDAFQATFLVLVRRAESVVPSQLVGNWLYGVACRTARNVRATSARRRAKERVMRDLPRDDAAVPAADLRPILDAELERLPSSYRASIVLCDLEGKSRREAARQLGLSEGTLSSRLARARDMLRGRLSRRGLSLPAAALAAALTASAAPAAVPANLLSATISTGALVAAGQSIAAAAPVSVALLTEGVLQAMFFSKLKIAAAVLLALGVIGTGAGVLAHHTFTMQTASAQPMPPLEADLAVPSGNPAAHATSTETQVADKGDVKDAAKEGMVEISGAVVAVADDGKRFTVEIPTKNKGEPGKRVPVVLTDETAVSYAVCQPNGARPTVGYSAVILLKEATADMATRVLFTGAAEPKPSFSGTVQDFTPGTGGFSAEAPDNGSTKTDPVVSVGVFKVTPADTYYNVVEGGARPTKGYLVSVWHTAANETIRSRFDGGAHPSPKQAGKPHRSGPVVDASRESVTVAVPPQAKGEAAGRAGFKITDKTLVTFNGVGPGGAKLVPDKDLHVAIWLAEGSTDTAARIQVSRGPKSQAPAFQGKVLAFTKETSQLSLEVTPLGKGESQRRLDVRISAATRVSYHNVGPDGASPKPGYQASVWLVEGSKDVAELVTFEPMNQARKPKSGEQQPPAEKGRPAPDKGGAADKTTPADKGATGDKGRAAENSVPAEKGRPGDKSTTDKGASGDKARPAEKPLLPEKARPAEKEKPAPEGQGQTRPD